MRRKFISAILFGLLMVAPTSTFVSCEDYDDDIKNLQTQIDANKTEMGAIVAEKVAALEAEVANLEAADAALEAADAANLVAAQTLVKEAKAELQGAVETVKASVAANGASIKELVAADAALQVAVEGAQAKAEAAYTLAQAADAKAAEALESLKTVKAALEAQVTALDAKLVAEVQKLAAADAAVAAQIAALEAAGTTIGAELKALEAAIEAQKAELTNTINAAVAGVQAEVDALEATVAGIQAGYTTAVAGLQTEVTALTAGNAKVATDLQKLAEKLDVLALLVRGELKSLVFQPDFYYHGIEAMAANSYEYNVKKHYMNVSADDTKGISDYEVFTSTKKVVMPDLQAVYHLNPSNATIDEAAENFSFLVFDKNYVRATVATPNIYEAKAKNGMLTVRANFKDAQLIKDIEKDGQVTVMALQYQYGDTVVTSDYAALRAQTYKDIALHLVGNTDFHLYKSAKDAVDNKYQVAIAWNNENGIDLATLVNAHYDTTAVVCKSFDTNAADGKIAKYGFKYSFDLVGYASGNNKTSETAHFGFKDGRYVRAQLTKDGKQQAWGYEQNEATINREPLVRVTLTDTIHNEIVSVGYIKFRIVEPAAVVVPGEPVYTTVDFGPYTKDYTVKCDDKEVFSQILKWYEVEEKILALVHMSKADFENTYELNMASGAAGAVQYTGAKGDDTYADYVGEVWQTTTDVEGHQTEVLKWTVSNNDAYKLFKNGSKAVKIYVRFVKKAGITTDPTFDYVNVSFTWTPATVNVTPSGAIDDETSKISNYWYAKNNGVAGTGYSDVHVNVEVIGQNGANCNFLTDLKNTFVGNKLPVVSKIASVYSELKLASNLAMVFVEETELYTNVPGVSGKKYTLSTQVNYANKESYLYATVAGSLPVKIATLSFDGDIEYLNNPTSQDLLNWASHSELGTDPKQTLTVKIGFDLTTCAPVNKFALENNTFYAKILRPISVTSGVAQFEDAATNGSEDDVELDFFDWRDKHFDADGLANNVNYYKYYGVTNIEADIDNITTNMNQSSKDKYVKLSSVTNLVKFDYIKTKNYNIENGEFGVIRYENNGNTVGDFDVRIPVTITYKWGTLKTELPAQVLKTVNNTNKK
ncbi:MAG: hypothetical protein J6R79_02105 [Bacteroidaceae bacterium]|nr:hypothetical protein [Bacteroidaceae bacterium]